jgi:pyruvate-formate lyase-activating enzyme
MLNDQKYYNDVLSRAFQFHGQGFLADALNAYEQCFAINSQDPLVLYGIGSIKLLQGDLSGYEIAKLALFNGASSSLDKPLASESIMRSLLRLQYQDHVKKLLNECEENAIIPNNLDELRKAVAIPSHLKDWRYDHMMDKNLQRYHPIENSNYVYAIDIVGGCNLRCPTCPVSNQTLPKGLMTIETYRKILSKIQKESPDKKADIWLFSWTEPLLHPQVDEFIKTAHEFGMTSFLSTNLNMGERIKSVMSANPTKLKISLSSLQQEIYSKTHARGNIESVVKNLHELAKWRDFYKSKTQIWIGHHLYKNTIDEQDKIKALADSLGFGYSPSVAIVAPIERVMKMKNDSDNVDGLRDLLLYNPLDLQKENSKKRSGNKDCELRFNMTTINHEGLVNLCCATTQTISNKPISFLDYSHEELEDMKYKNSFCKKCMNVNLHLTISDK